MAVVAAEFLAVYFDTIVFLLTAMTTKLFFALFGLIHNLKLNTKPLKVNPQIFTFNESLIRLCDGGR